MDPQQMQTCSDEEFLALLAQQDIRPRLENGKLRISAPAGSIDESVKAELLRRKPSLVELLASRPLETAHAFDPTSAPLSYAQERLWLLERFHPGNYAYNIPESFPIRAAMDRAILQRSIDYLLDRHSILRTGIVEDASELARQKIHPHVAAPLHFVDLRKLEGAAKQQRLDRMLRGLSREPFDLRIAPLVRFVLVQMEAESFVAFINIHHIISDRWSMRILYREMLAAYSAYAAGKEPALPLLPLQYGEYAHRERSLGNDAAVLTGGRSMQQQLQYWQQKLANAPAPPELPFRRQAKIEKPFDGAIAMLAMTYEDTAGIRKLARQYAASPYMVTLAVLTALIFRYTGMPDICIGSPVSERNRTDTEGLIGLFVNTLILRCAVAGELSFAQLLESVRETVLDAQANHEVPLQRILRELHPGVAASGQPLFQTMLGFDSYMGEDRAGEDTPVDPGFAKFEMTFQFHEQPAGIGGWIEYRTDLFTEQAMQKFGEAFLLLLRDAARDPSTPVSKLTLLSAEERHRLLVTWNDTATDFPRDLAIHKLFEQQVERTPDAIAVIDGAERLSYRELNRSANRIAHGLLTHGVQPQTIVGVHLERTAEMVAVLLGILKAGCAYLPLDPQYPEQRLRMMVDDSACPVVLSRTDLPVGPAAQLLSPLFAELAAVELDRNPTVAVGPAYLAYVIYTSGSTGRPKGVAIEHHSAVNFLHWGAITFPKEVLRGTLASTSISFDLSVFEIFVPLIRGATIILAQDVLALPTLAAAGEVTLITTVPSAAAGLLAVRGIPPSVRAINLAGEALSTQLVERLYTETALADVNDLYGPTETTTYSTWNRRSPGRRATIGRPLANTRLYLLDASLELVPEGAPGELFIAGEGVAREYLGNAALTREKFPTLAHLGEHGRAYRTGDLCRYQQDGTLEYLGRMDNQVKVRGFRVELGEIEAALMAHATVKEAVVVARKDGEHGASLAACLELETGAMLNVPELILHQSRTLPPHMVARSIAAVDRMPRTANGKVDRKQLAAIQMESAPGGAVVPPNDDLERELLSIWQEQFGHAAIGIDHNFFELGGHSLLALRLFAEIEARLKRRLMLSVLFQAPTVRQLAEYMRSPDKN